MSSLSFSFKLHRTIEGQAHLKVLDFDGASCEDGDSGDCHRSVVTDLSFEGKHTRYYLEFDPHQCCLIRERRRRRQGHVGIDAGE
jgi:hypothetical protein